MLEGLVIGWDEIEPLFLVNIALSKPFILLGKHGTCKTTCAREIAKIFGPKAFRFYDATKDDLISIAGIPIPQKLAQGKLEFSEHDRSIWQARVIVIDELTRANKENQNLWLEIIEEKSCFGKKLKYEALIATMNPESYAATFKLDEALLDRFYAILSVPDLQKGTSSDVFKQIIDMNLKKQKVSTTGMQRAMERIGKTYREFHENRDVVNLVSDYVSQYMEVLLSKVDNYISPRKTIHLVEEILGLAAYFKNIGKEDFLNAAAKTALVYVLGLPLKIKMEILMHIHANLEQILSKRTIDNRDKLRIELSKLSNSPETIWFIRRHIGRIEKYLPFDEVEKLLAWVIDQSPDENMLRLRAILNRLQGHEELKRIVEGRITLYVIDAIDTLLGKIKEHEITNDDDFAMMDKVSAFIPYLKKLPLNEKIVQYLFSKEYGRTNRIRNFIRKGGFNADQPEASPGV
jgi:MoxR-like ATPase